MNEVALGCDVIGLLLDLASSCEPVLALARTLLLCFESWGEDSARGDP